MGFLERLFGFEPDLVTRFVVAFIVVMLLIAVTAWVVRRLGSGRGGFGGSRARQQRLSLVDATQVDARRRLVLLRRDDVEHLVLIGGPSDVVVESRIAQRPAEPRQEPATGPAGPRPPQQQPRREEPPAPARPEPAPAATPPAAPSRPAAAPQSPPPSPRSQPPQSPPPQSPASQYQPTRPAPPRQEPAPPNPPERRPQDTRTSAPADTPPPPREPVVRGPAAQAGPSRPPDAPTPGPEASETAEQTPRAPYGAPGAQPGHGPSGTPPPRFSGQIDRGEGSAPTQDPKLEDMAQRLESALKRPLDISGGPAQQPPRASGDAPGTPPPEQSSSPEQRSDLASAMARELGADQDRSEEVDLYGDQEKRDS